MRHQVQRLIVMLLLLVACKQESASQSSIGRSGFTIVATDELDLS
jgi:hypothetical protein